MNAMKDQLPALVRAEKEAANRLHGPFASLHEGYAVLLEEITETSEELDSIWELRERLWKAVRRDDAHLAGMAAETIERLAVNVAAEALQVAAMAQKLQDVGRGERDE